MELKKLLKKNNLKVTPIRLKLLSILQSQHGPFSPEELKKKLKDIPCDLVTIYRNVTALSKANLINQVMFQGHGSKYEFNHGSEHHHHHIVCRECGSIKNFDFCFVKEAEKLVEKLGYQEISHSLEFYGQCKACAAA